MAHKANPFVSRSKGPTEAQAFVRLFVPTQIRLGGGGGGGPFLLRPLRVSMASLLRVARSFHGFHGGVVCDTRFPFSAPAGAAAERNLTPPQQPRNGAALLLGHISRRDVLLFSVLPLGLSMLAPPSKARERRGRKAIPPEEYVTSPDGLKYYDLIEGNGPIAEKGATVQVHFDCIYRSITAVSSRESKLLAGNRIIAQPYEFTVGSPPGKERKREYVDRANGLFSAQAAPKPPAAMYKVTEGMRVGGKRTVIVPPELGYGQKGMNEIPPGATFELNVELLQVASPAAK